MLPTTTPQIKDENDCPKMVWLIIIMNNSMKGIKGTLLDGIPPKFNDGGDGERLFWIGDGESERLLIGEGELWSTIFCFGFGEFMLIFFIFAFKEGDFSFLSEIFGILFLFSFFEMCLEIGKIENITAEKP